MDTKSNKMIFTSIEAWKDRTRKNLVKSWCGWIQIGFSKRCLFSQLFVTYDLFFPDELTLPLISNKVIKEANGDDDFEDVLATRRRRRRREVAKKEYDWKRKWEESTINSHSCRKGGNRFYKVCPSLSSLSHSLTFFLSLSCYFFLRKFFSSSSDSLLNQKDLIQNVDNSSESGCLICGRRRRKWSNEWTQ